MVGGIPWHRILLHDMSKFHPKEFFGYARQFYRDGQDQLGFSKAWLHHQNVNDHHPEYFIMRGYHKKMDKEPEYFEPIFFEVSLTATGKMAKIKMPEVCMREMVADWIGAGITYGGTADMTEWLEKNLISKLNLVHSESEAKIISTLERLGYDTNWLLKERY